MAALRFGKNFAPLLLRVENDTTPNATPKSLIPSHHNKASSEH